ncbi:hypothetical protein IWQ62_002770 [Dispira parvispora]|uniref:Zn(2)-C6 fungal-type domain-containing protein n=1 Tax=Dispira parvispora TaxID=1520584 RepID=A0A9W8AVE9_9FUNG|nr:hypothetical protein IWQ62_002770 [Dispira parvispora]
MESVQQRKLPIARLAQPEAVTVRRASQACQHCRAHKLKCDKRLPTCTTCLQYDTSCKYVLTESKRRRLQTRQGSQTQPSRKAHVQPLLASAVHSRLSSSPSSSSSDAQAPKFWSVESVADSLTLGENECSVEQTTTSEVYGQDTTTTDTTATSFFPTLLEVESLYQVGKTSAMLLNIPELSASVVPQVPELPSMSPKNMTLEAMTPPGDALSSPLSSVISNPTQPVSYTEGLDQLSRALRDNLTLNDWSASDGRPTTTLDADAHRAMNCLLADSPEDDMLNGTKADLEPIISRMNDPQRRARFAHWFENTMGVDLPACILRVKNAQVTRVREQLLDRLRNQPYILTLEDYRNGGHVIFIPESLPSLRCLVLPTDLLFHSHVVHSLLYLANHALFHDWGNIHHQRIMNRVAQGRLSPMTFLPLAAIFGPLASHAALKNLLPSAVGRRYLQSFVSLMPNAISDDSPNVIQDLLLAATCAFSQNYPTMANHMTNMAVQACYRHRLHLLDHPQFAQVVRRDMPWLSNLSTTPCQYPAESSDPVLKQHFRNIFWMTVIMDSFLALVNEQLPRIHPEEISIREPLSKQRAKEITCPIATNPLSPYNTDMDYPTIPIIIWDYNPLVRIDFSLSQRVHQVSQTRPLYTRDRLRWETEWHRVESQLDQWHREYTTRSFQTNVSSLSPEDFLHHIKDLNQQYFNYATYYMLVVYLHYHGPLLTWPFSANDSDTLQDVDMVTIGPLLAQGERSWERCWEATVAMENLMKRVFPFITYFQNTFTMSAFYTAAVICCHTLAITSKDDPDPQKQERWHFADQFTDDLTEYFTRYSQFWPINHRLATIVHNLKLLALGSTFVPEV